MKFYLFSCGNSLLWLWNLGFSCGISLMMQVLTGLLLALSYETQDANISMEKMESLSHGWLWSSAHSMGSTLYFMSMYLHMGSSIISCNKEYNSWISGIILYLISLIMALLGYSLTKGNMAQWALTVVTSIVLTLPKGESLFKMLMGDFGISDKILPSIYTLHFLLGTLIPMMMLWHLNEVHKKEFCTDLKMSNSTYGKEFLSSGMVKDILMSFMMLLLLNQGFKGNSYIWMLIEDVNSNDWPQKDSTPEPMGPEWYILYLFSGLKMTSLNKLILGIMMVSLGMSKEYYSNNLLMIILGMFILLGYLALTSHISLEEPVMLAYFLLILSYFIFILKFFIIEEN